MDINLQQQLEIFLQTIRTPALKFAANRCGNVDDALDMLQEAMIDFVASAEKFPQEAWKNLFYKILVRRITDRFRKSQWRNKLAKMFSLSSHEDEDNDCTFEPVEFDDSEEMYRADELSQQFDKALKALPGRQQEAYMLRQWQHLSVRETAEIMNCSEGSVKTHLSRAMSNLKQALGDWIDE